MTVLLTIPRPNARLGVVDPTPRKLKLARQIVARGRPWRGREDVWFSPAPLLTGGGSVAFLFPGLEAEFEPRVSDVASALGTSIPELSTSNIGRHAAAVLAISRLLDQAVRAIGVRPDAVVGHSVGEWAAMIAGGMVSGDDFDTLLAATDLDALRVPGIEFVVAGCPAPRVRDFLADQRNMVISHENSTNQTVVCGPAAAVRELVTELRAHGVICQVLPFRSGFHTPMLEPYLDVFAAGVPSLPMTPAETPVWSATTAAPFPADPAAARELCVRHLVEPVRFREVVLGLHAAGVRVFVQMGPGQLGSLVTDTLRDEDYLTVAANSPHRPGVATLRRLATALWVEGGDPNFALLDEWESATAPPSTAPAATEPAAGVPRTPPAPGINGTGHHRQKLGARWAPVDNHQPVDNQGHGRSGAPELSDPPGSVEPGAGGQTSTRVAPPSTTVAPRPTTVAPPPITVPPPASVARLVELGATMPVAAEFGAVLAEAAASVVAVLEPPDVLDVSTSAMPYLLDHCLAEQRPGWPDEADRRPVVPGATMVVFLAQAALRAAAPGHVVTEVRDVRFHQWLEASPPRRIPIETTPRGGNQFAVRLGDHAEAVVTVGKQYAPPPEPWAPVNTERAPKMDARQLYDERWLFHGPAFQGVTRTHAVSEHTIRGELTVLPPPGALLDAVGHLLGQWLIEHHGDEFIAFPVRIGRILFHDAEPAMNSTVDCSMRFDGAVRAEARLSAGGRPYASISDWQDILFDASGPVQAVHRHVSTSTLSTRECQGWRLPLERLSSNAIRELVRRKYFGQSDEGEIAEVIAIKDAVRGFLWDRGAGPIFPAELRVGPDRRVTGRHGRAVPDLDIEVRTTRGDVVVTAKEARQ